MIPTFFQSLKCKLQTYPKLHWLSFYIYIFVVGGVGAGAYHIRMESQENFDIMSILAELPWIPCQTSEKWRSEGTNWGCLHSGNLT